MTRVIILSCFVVGMVLACGFPAAFAQDCWQQTNGPYGGEVQSLAINSSGHIFAGTFRGGIFRSEDNCENWTKITGITSQWSWVKSIAINSSDHIFAGIDKSHF